MFYMYKSYKKMQFQTQAKDHNTMKTNFQFKLVLENFIKCENNMVYTCKHITYLLTYLLAITYLLKKT